MRFTVCESIDPPVKELLQKHFILWYCDVDNSTEWYPYASGLGSFTLPLISIVSVADDSVYLDRSTAVQYAGEFHSRLQSHIGDVDHSVSITLADAIVSLQLLAGELQQTLVYKDGNVDDDQKIGLAEVVYLLGKLSQ